MEILKVENLTKKYGKNESEVIAVNNMSFSVQSGEFIAIVGSSGSNKSTLLLLKTSNKKYNQTIIMITHNPEIAKVADRIIRIEDGKIIKLGQKEVVPFVQILYIISSNSFNNILFVNFS